MNFLGIGPMELVLVVVLALIVLGPEKLPEAMAQLGKVINELRNVTAQLSDEFNRTIQAEINETRSVFDDTRAAVSEARSTLDEAVSGTPAAKRVQSPREPEASTASESALASANGTTGQHDLDSHVPGADTQSDALTPAAAHPRTPGEGSASDDLLPPY
jgi:sec-independent protein translocase protein TatB